MAGESVRDLVVRLAFEGGDAQGEMKRMSAAVGGLEGGFKKASTSAGTLGAATDTLKARAKALTEAEAKQADAVQKAQAALEAKKGALERATVKKTEYTRKLDEAKAKEKEAAAAVKAARTAYDAAAKSQGAESDAAKALAKAVTQAEEAHQKAKDITQKLTGQVNACARSYAITEGSIQRATVALGNAKTGMKDVRAQIAANNTALATLQSNWVKAAAAMQSYGDAATTAGRGQNRAGNALMLGVTTPIVAAAGAAVKSVISYESAFAGVEKTVDATDEELRQMSNTILEMSTRMPTTAEDIAGVAEAAGQLGIQTRNIAGFTETMIGLASATNLSLSDAPATIAKFANVMGTSQTSFDRLGSSIVALGNTTATTEADIVEMAMRLSGAGKQVGMTEAQVLGLSTGLSSVGIETQAGGSAFSKLISGMAVAVATGSKQVADYAKVAGMSSKEFSERFKVDAAGALTAFVDGLSRMSEEGISSMVVLEEMGIKELRLRDSLLRTSNAGGLLSQSIATATDAWRENTALSTEVVKRNQTLESRLTMLGNKATNTGRKFGQTLVPALESAMASASGIVDSIAGMNEGQVQAAVKAAAFAAALGPVTKLVGSANIGIGKLSTGTGKLMASLVGANGKMLGFGAATKGVLTTLGGMLGPAGIAAVAVGVGVLAYKLYDAASGAKAAREATSQFNDAVAGMAGVQGNTAFSGAAESLDRFGVSVDAFKQRDNMATWLLSVKAEWGSAAKRTKEEVAAYVAAYTAGSDDIRAAMDARREKLRKAGVGGKEMASVRQDQKDLAALDKQTKTLLTKKRNGKLNDRDERQLEKNVTRRMELERKYTASATDGYDEIQRGMDAERERAKLAGETVNESNMAVDALAAATKGNAAYRESIDAQYTAQKAVIDAMADSDAKTKAAGDLQAWYAEQVTKGKDAYQAAMLAFGKGAGDDPKIKKGAEGLNDLMFALNGAYDAEGKITDAGKVKINDWLASFGTGADAEAALASVTALATQMQELKKLGATDQQLKDTFGIDSATILQQYQAVADFAKKNKGTFEGLNTLFGTALPEETINVLLEMDAKGAQKVWDDFVADKGKIEPKLYVGDMTEDELTAWKEKHNAALGLTPTATVALKDGAGDALKGDLQTRYFDGDGNEITAWVKGLPPDEQDRLKASALVAGVDANGNLAVVVDAEPPANGLKLTAAVTLSPLEQGAINAWEQNEKDNGKEVNKDGFVRLGLTQNWESDLQTAYEAGKLVAFGADGLPLEVTLDLLSTIGPNDIAGNEDGIITVFVQPIMKDPIEAVADAGKQPYKYVIGGGDFSVTESIQEYAQLARMLADPTHQFAGGREAAKKDIPAGAVNELFDFDTEQAAKATTAVTSIVKALREGQELESGTATWITDFATVAGLIEGTKGVNVPPWFTDLQNALTSAGLAQQGQTLTDLFTNLKLLPAEADKATAGVAGALDKPLDAAVEATKGDAFKKKAIEYAAAVGGVGTTAGAALATGLEGTDISLATAALMRSTKSGLATLPTSMNTIGLGVGKALASGAKSEAALAAVSSAGTTLGNALKNAARRALGDTSGGGGGGMTTKSFGGLAGMTEVAGIDASGVLGGAEVSGMSVSSSQSRTVNANVTIQVEHMAVRSDADIDAIARQISALNQRALAGYGLRG